MREQRTRRQQLAERSVLGILGGGATIYGLGLITRFVVGTTLTTLAVAETALLLVTLACLLGPGVLGGYVASVIVRRAEAAHALVLGGLLAAGVLVVAMLVDRTDPVWFRVALAAGLVAASLAGAWLRVRQRTPRLPGYRPGQRGR